MASAASGGFKSFLVNGLTVPFRYIARFQKWVAETVPKLPGYEEVNAAATQVTWPLRIAADYAVRKIPGVKRFEWLLETQRLSVYPPILLALTLLFVLWRGLQTTNLGHIGTDLLIFPTLSSISVFNPFLGLISGLCFSIGDILQKLVVNDMYATPRGMFAKYGSLNYWGAIAGYIVGSSSLMFMGLAPGITSRLFRQGTRLALRKVFYKRAMAAADGARPPDGGFGVRVFVRTRPDGTLEYQAGARTPGPGWEPHTGPMSKEEASALLDRVQHGESLPSGQGSMPSRPGVAGPGQVSTTGSRAKSDWTRPTGADGGETRRYSPWTNGAADAGIQGIAGPGQVWGRSQGKGEVPAGGGLADDAIRRYQPGLADLTSAGLGDLKSAGISELKNAGLSDMKSAGLSDLKSGGLSDLKSAGLSDMKSAGLSDMKSAGLSDMKSAGLSDMKSAGLSEMKSAGLSDLMKGAGLGETKIAGLSELKNGDPWGKSDVAFEQPPVAPPSQPPPSSSPRRRRPPVAPPPAAYVPPPAPSDVPVAPEPMPSPRRKPQNDDPHCGLLDEVEPPMPEYEPEIICPPDDLDDLLGPGGPGDRDRDRNRSPYDSNDGLPVYPTAEMLMSIVGTIAGAATGMFAAPTLVSGAFHWRPNPDISCFLLEQGTYMHGRAGEVGLEAGLGGNALENAVKRPPGGGGGGGVSRAAAPSTPPGLSQEEAAALRSRIEKAEETYAFMGNEALQDRKTELIDRLERGEFVDEAEVNRLLVEAGQNLGAYYDDVARKDAISDQISQSVKDAKDAADARQDELFSQLWTLEDQVSGYFKTDKDGNEVWVEGRLSSAAGLGRMDMWHDRVVKDGTIDEAELLNMKESMEGARSMELDADMRRHLALEEANQNADYVVRQAQNAAVVVAIAATGGAAAGALATGAGLGSVGTAAVGYGVGIVGGAAGGGAMSYMDGGSVIDGALMGGGAALVLGPIGMGLGAGATHLARHFAPSLVPVIANPIIQGAGMGFGFTAAQRAITGEGDLLEGTFLGGVGGWGAHGGTILGNRAAAPFAPPPPKPAAPKPQVRQSLDGPESSPRDVNWGRAPAKPQRPGPGPRTSEPDYLGVHDEVGPHYDANRRILEGVGGDDLIGPRGSRVSDDTIFTGQPKEDFNVTRPGGSRASDDTIATGPFREDLNQTRTSTRTGSRPTPDDTIETPLSRRDTIETRPRGQDLDQTLPGTSARDGGKLVNPIDPTDLKLPPPGELPWAADVDAIAGKYSLKEINQAIDHARVHNPRAVPMLESARHNRFSSGIEFQPPAAPQRQGPPAWFEEPIVPSRGSVDDINLSRPAGSRVNEPTIETNPRGQDLNRTRPATTDDGPGTGTTRRPPADDPFANDSLEQLRYNEQLARQAGDGDGADHFANLIRQRVAAGEVDAPRGIRPSASDVDAMGGNAIPEPTPAPRSIKPTDVPEPGPAPRKSPLPERPDALDWSEFQGPREDALPEFRSKVPDRPRNPFDDGLPADATRRGIDPADDPRIAKPPSEPVAKPDELDWSKFKGPREDVPPEFRSQVPDRPRVPLNSGEDTAGMSQTRFDDSIAGNRPPARQPGPPKDPFGDGLPADATRRGIDPADDPRIAKAASEPVSNRTRTGSEFDEGTAPRSSSTRDNITSRDQGTSSQRNVTNVEGEGAPPPRDVTANGPGAGRPTGQPAYNPDDVVVTGKRPTQEQMDNLFRTRTVDELVQAQQKALADGDQQSAMMLQHVLEAKGHRPVIDPDLIPPKPLAGELPRTSDIEAIAKQYTEQQLRAARDAATDPHQRQILEQAADTRWGMAKEGTGQSWQPPHVRDVPRDIPRPHLQKGPELTEIPTEMPPPRPGVHEQTIVEDRGPRVPSRPIVDPPEPQVRRVGDEASIENTPPPARTATQDVGEPHRPPNAEEPVNRPDPQDEPRARTIDDSAETSPADLTPEDIRVLRKYTGNEFIRMNEALRSGDPDAIAPFRAQIDQGVAALEKLPAERGTFYRGIDVDDPAPIAARYKPGETVTEDYFMSTSQNPGDELGGNIKFRVTTRSARDVSGWSPNPESEMLIPPGKRFFVKESYTDHDGNQCVVMEEVD